MMYAYMSIFYIASVVIMIYKRDKKHDKEIRILLNEKLELELALIDIRNKLVEMDNKFNIN